MHMTLIQRDSQAFRFGRVIGAPIGIAALAATVGCGVQPAGNSVSAQPLAGQPAVASAAQPAGSPVVVSCEPHQRTLVRPVVVNGAQLSQVECITNGDLPVAQPVQYVAPVTYRAARPAAVPVGPVVYDEAGDARVVSTARPVSTARAIPTRQVVYRDEVPVRPKRSVAKSAVIIGSSAGAGAGVGALIGGKKGALIGAAVGGGGATLWDQVTRRQK
jgi:hypothetical protein